MQNFNEKINMIWQIAESLRNVYRPEKYGDVILPLSIMRRFDCVLVKTKDKVLAEFEKIKNLPANAQDFMLKKVSGEPFYNVSNYTFERLLNDSENISANLRNYIDGFSADAREILEHFNFEAQIVKLDKNNALYNVIKEFNNVNFHPEVLTNLEMGYIFEELIRRFKENAEAGDHYTPREVIRLCVSLMLGDTNENFSEDGLITTLADFACGTGGMLSEGEKYIKEMNEHTKVELFGQEINDESFAICKADMLIKGENADNIILGNSLTEDGHRHKEYRYLISNPPFGVQWKKEEKFVKEEFNNKGFEGRFGAGTPRVSDGSLLFLLNMIDKMKKDEKGSRIAIIFNGSPLFTGDAGSGESNIRKWIIENDMLEGIVAMPDSLFYNTGISTYIWILSNRKSVERQGKIQLVNAANFFKPMRKSLGNKRKEISEEQINVISEIYGNFEEGENCKIFDNEDFGFRKVTIERPLKLNFKVDEERIQALKEQSQFINLAVSKKKDAQIKAEEEQAGKRKQESLISMLESFDSDKVYKNRDKFTKELKAKIKEAKLDFVKGALLKAVINVLSKRDDTADVCKDSKGNIEADSTLRDTETIPLKEDVTEYFNREVKPHVPDAWIKEDTLDNVGYEIPFTRHFYKYEKLRKFTDIMEEVKELEQEIQEELKEVLS